MTAAATVRERARAITRDNPSWAPWLDLLAAAAATTPPLAASLSVRLASATPSRSAAPAPLLADAELTVGRRPLEAAFSTLLAVAAHAPGGAPLRAAARRLEPAPFLAAALAEDEAALEALARARDLPAPPLAAVAAALVATLLRAVAADHHDRVPAGWSQGYCPLCAAWPALAELRGLERARRLRCGRCGADWELPWLRCAHCRCADHTRLGALLPAAASDPRQVETCSACRGYLKALPTLLPLAAEAVPLEDLATVELDLAAMARGFARPPATGLLRGIRLTGR